MGKDNQGGVGGVQNAGRTAGVGSEAKVSRKHKVYDHKMTPAESFALQTVQRAQSALRVVNDAIKSGKCPSKHLINLCTEVVQEAGSILFPET